MYKSNLKRAERDDAENMTDRRAFTLSGARDPVANHLRLVFSKVEQEDLPDAMSDLLARLD